jgi:KipI family sensor histidine kinase inhibitor
VWSRSVPVGEARRLGDHALVIGVPEARSARALIAALRASARHPVTELVGGLATVMVSVDPEAGDPVGPTPLDELESWVGDVFRHLDPSTTVAGAGIVVEVPCVFDGPDLGEVAEHSGCDADRVMAHMTAADLTVAVVGFSPGFAYLEGLPGALASVPRRRTPRTVVPAGSVAVANGYAAVYPSASPGGWHLIGRTAEPFFDPGVPPYARLAPGDRVRFVARSELPPPPAASSPPAAPSPAGAGPVGDGPPVFVVEQPGLRTLRQDGGRRGVAALGVPGAGPADPFALEVANRLVGNAPEATALEVTAKGPVLRCLSSTFVAVVGAAPDIELDGQPVPAGQVVPVGPGQRLAVGLLRHGLRCYVAVAGGLVGPAVLGSCATDQLCGLGPGPLAVGDQLRAGPVTPPMGDHVSAADGAARSTGPADVVLRVVPGPHPERFTTGTFDALSTRTFTVGADSNRIGLRLRAAGGGPVVPAGHEASELDSQGTVTGVVQIPPDGQPVILLPDHATLGGYPVLAVVATADHGVLGQCAPGDVVRLVPITHAEADQAWAVRRRSLRSAVVGHYPLAVD